MLPDITTSRDTGGRCNLLHKGRQLGSTAVTLPVDSGGIGAVRRIRIRVSR